MKNRQSTAALMTAWLLWGCSMLNSRPEQYFEGQQLYAARAIADGDVKRLRAVLRPEQVDTPGKKGMTLLWFAMQEEQFEAIELLVSRGSKPHEQVVQGLGSPLFHAMRSKDLRLLAAFLDGGFPVNHTGRDGVTLLHMAAGAIGASIEHVKLLVERGADINAQDSIGETPLTEATATLQPDRARYLLQRGARIDTYTTGGVTPAWGVRCVIARQAEGPMRRQFEELRDLMIAKGAHFPPDPPEKVRAWMKTQGMRVSE
jgi:hypothetical protein